MPRRRGHRDFVSEHKEIAEIRGDQVIPQAAGRQRRVFKNTFFGKQLKMKKTGNCLGYCFPKKVFLKTLSAPAACGRHLHSFNIPHIPSFLSVQPFVVKILVKNEKRKRLYCR